MNYNTQNAKIASITEKTLIVKISKVNSTVRLCGGIYSYMSGV